MEIDDSTKEAKGIKKYERLLRSKKKEAKLSAINEIREQGFHDRKTIRLLEGVLEQTYKPDEWNLKNEVIILLGNLASKHSVHHLVAHLHDENPVVRESSAYALGQIGDKRATPDLTTALDDIAFSVREKAANALSKLGDPRAVDALARMASSADMEVRLSILPALAGFENNPKIIDVLVATLKDKETSVRFPAIIAFNKIKCARAIEPLIENLESEDPLLQKVASDALTFNLGWGSVEEGKLTKFGESRRKILLASISGDVNVDSGEIISLDSVADEVANLLSLDAQAEENLREYFKKLGEKHNLIKK
jgi:HEAT repeat protein